MNHREAVFRAIEQMQQLAGLFSKRRRQLAGRAELTEAEWRVLEGVAAEHFMPSMFADELDNTRGSVSKILKQLSEKKLIKAAISPDDGRQRVYTLTPKGVRTLDKLRALREEAIREIWSDLPLEELKAFNRLGDRLIENLKDYAAKEENQ